MRRLGRLCAAAVTALATLGLQSVLAVPPPVSGSSDLPPAAAPAGERAAPAVPIPLPRAAARPDDLVEVLVELQEPPVLERYTRLKSSHTFLTTQKVRQVQRYLARIHAAQQRLADLLTGSPVHATIYARTQRVFNGMAVQVQAGHLEAICRLPGVKAVHILTPWSLAQAEPSVPAAPVLQERSEFAPVWAEVGAGDGVRVGIIDSGVDYTHAALGGSGDPAAYTANNPAVIEPGTFPTAKVAGGRDFVGDSYDAAGADPDQRIPRPDPDPLDRNGHGTFVAGIIAGVGVLENGAKYEGSYNETTFQQSFSVPPGGAPRATLYAAKVAAGNNLVTDPAVLVAAFDYLVDPDGDGSPADAMDVINMSLAQFFIPDDHPVNRAIRNAGEADVLTVTAVGNAGDTHYIAGMGAGLDIAGLSEPAGAAGAGFSVAALLDFPASSSRGGNGSPRGAAPNRNTGPMAGSGNQAKTADGTSGSAARAAAKGAVGGKKKAAKKGRARRRRARAMNTSDSVARPGNPPEVQAVRRNTGDDRVYRPAATLPLYGPARVGAGQLNPVAALDPPALILSAVTEEPQISFGLIEALAGGLRTAAQDWYVQNELDTPLTLRVELAPTSEVPGVEVALLAPNGSPLTQLQVPASGRADASLRLTLNPAAMKHTHDPTLSETVGATPRHWLSEVSGYVVLTPLTNGTEGRPLRLPYYAAARPASDMGTMQTALSLPAATGTVVLNQTGQSLPTAVRPPVDEAALVTPLELQEISPDDPLTTDSSNHSDLKYVGVRSNFTSQPAAARRIYFGIATHGPWRTPNEVRVNIFIDVDRDGTDDFRLVNTVVPNEVRAPSDAFITGLFNLKTGAGAAQGFLNVFSAAQFNTVPFNTNVMVLPVLASALGLTDANARFDYQVRTQIGAVVVDQSQRLTYDAARPGLDPGPTPTFFDLPAQVLRVNYNRAHLTANRSLGLLLLHHHNALGRHDQILRVD